MRSNGILCPISCLPSNYGIGDLGKPSYEFVKLLNKGCIKYWQILPLNPVDCCNSPYASSCDTAIDPIYISLELLKEDGLINKLKKVEFPTDKIDYNLVRNYKMHYLKNAYKLQKDVGSADFLKFLSENSWLEKYALFQILLKKNHNKVLYEWNKKDKEAFYKDKELLIKYSKQINFIYWVQYKLFNQLELLKKELAKYDVKLIGDLPFYVGLNSSDFFGHLDEFLINYRDCSPKMVAGVPPDYFSPQGQLWGNPCYDVQYMKDNNYSFFKNRIAKALRKYDVLRLDHFRAFDTYYSIPFGSKNAINGKWENGIGHPFFELLKKENILDRLIVEDLGDVFPSVFKLRDDFNLPGMNILQFSIFDNAFDVKEKQIIYTGSHDNETIVGFYKNLTKEQKEILSIKFRYEGIKSKKTNWKFIEYAHKSICELSIIPIQDYLGLDNKARINTPGIAGNMNWTFRLKNYKDFIKVLPKIVKMNEMCKR
ncbi:MAG: 4-alpha-glucanotransferase [Mollicutes bacterium]|nr:4-alpha-glucanotransferase [Mollicutes bacterium]MDD7264521.1 4-alpha-glucanotransferase [bacterium]MDY4979606.1 4-alpha-glucanotransferase [Candidatus Onthovivens sp.]